MSDKNYTKVFAEVTIPLAAAGTFTYDISENPELIKVGSRVLVSFGAKKIYAGIVMSITQQEPKYKTKPIIDVLDSEPVIQPESIQFWQWMSDYYMCTLGEVCEAALPAMMKIHSETRLYAIEQEVPLTMQSQEIDQAFTFIRGAKEVSIKDLQTIFSPAKVVRITRQMVEAKLIGVREAVSEQYKPKTQRILELNTSKAGKGKLSFDDLHRSPAQKKLIEFFWNNPKSIVRSDLKEKIKTSDAAIKALIEKDWLRESVVKVERFENNNIQVEPIPQLSENQQNAYDEISGLWQRKIPTLLYGVTSSGKTEVYFHLISKIIQQGKQALVLLPEIALTGQLVKRFQRVFGSNVGVYHSKIHAAQRIELWHAVRKNEKFKVIIGPRSAIFLPYKNLGCIVVDEEHDRSYKQQDPAPRYNARDAAVVLSNLYKAPLLLGTATPSLESLANYKAKKYGLVKLTERFGNFTPPEIMISDYAKWWRRHKVKAHMTPDLQNAIRESLDNGKQVILFQNRRGFSPYLQCFACGHIPICPHCDVRLTYHKRENNLVCHYCGFTKKNKERCEECGTVELKPMGFGTEKIEEELGHVFPEAKIARFDQDATRRKNSHEQIIGKFDIGEIDILVGTQMVTKGLDFKNVNLVGVLNADNLFSFPDFRSHERSMQLLMQVAGRAGRHGNNGRVIIQTSQPEHPVINFLKRGNYGYFAEKELEERNQFRYPPFTRIIVITIKHKKDHVCSKAAKLLAANCRTIKGTITLGPQAPVIERIQQYYIKEIIIKMERSKETLRIKGEVTKAILEVLQTEGLKSVNIIPDMDPY
jgi:primosomal protein N' (replication factor Y)